MVKVRHQTIEEENKRKPLTASERQAARRRRLKTDELKYSEYLEKQRALVKKRRDMLTDRENSEQRAKESARRRELRKIKKDVQTPPGVNSPTGYSKSSSLARAVKRVDVVMPKSPGKKRAVVKQLACKVKLNFVGKRKRQSNRQIKEMADEIRAKVKEFYAKDDISRWTPGKAEYVTSKDAFGKKIKLQKRYLQVTLSELYQLFKKENPDVKVGRSLFCSLRPPNVMFSSQMPHNTCHCKYHENMVLLLEGLHKKSTSVPTYSSEFPNTVICDNPTDLCWLNKCPLCNDAQIFTKKHPLENLQDGVDGVDSDGHSESEGETTNANSTVWYQWQDTKNERGTTVLAKVLHEGELAELYEIVVAALPKFMHHCFIKRVQNASYDKCKDMLKDDPTYAVMQFDFSENMTCEWQDAPQSTHWHKSQITIFTSVTWHLSASSSKVVISDDRGHNKDSIIVFLDTLLNSLPSSVKNIVFWSDGPSSQFKNKFTGVMLKFFESKRDLKIKWNYFATSHGKGPVDGVGAIIKRFVTSKIMTRKVMVQDVQSFVKASEGCDIEVMVKERKAIDDFLEEHQIKSLFESAEKIPDVSLCHTMQLVEGEIKTQKYEGNNRFPTHQILVY